MSKFTVSAVFLGVLSFFVMWETSGVPFVETFNDENKRESECHSVFSGFPKFSEDIPEYMERLEAILRNSYNIDVNIHEKILAVKFLGEIGVKQPDSASKALQVLTDTFTKRATERIKSLAIGTATNLVLSLSSEKLSEELINSLLAFIEGTTNDRLLHIALRDLKSLAGLMQPDSFSKALQVLTDTVRKEYWSNDERIKALAIKTATGLVLNFSSEKLSEELINSFLAFIAETKSSDEEIQELVIKTVKKLAFSLSSEKLSEELMNLLLALIVETKNPYRSRDALKDLENLTKKYPHTAFSTIKNILRIYGGEFKEDTLETSENQFFVSVSGRRSLNPFSRFFLLNPNNIRRAKIRKHGKGYLDKLEADMSLIFITRIVLQSPSSVQEEIEEFVKNILRFDGYSKIHKDMASEIYEDLSRKKLGKLPSSVSL